MRRQNQLQPDLIGMEVVEGEVAQSSVFGAAKAVLDSGVTTVTSFQDGDVSVSLVSDEDLESEALVVVNLS